MNRISLDELFDRRLSFPDIDARKRYARLVGIDETKSLLTKMLAVLVNPAGPKTWAKNFHPNARVLLEFLERRPPLVILEGDVGTGKTELAETVGDAVARQEGIGITLFPLSLATRGSGRVGEMTQLLSAAFDYTFEEANKLKTQQDKARGGVIFLVDEADALTQSREESQMHHEDRAGVNAFIRGIDRLAEKMLPVVVIMCTNRLSAIDPAVQRRAVQMFEFGRPSETQRRAVLEVPLQEAGFDSAQIDKLVQLTGIHSDVDVGFNFSDLTQRLLPNLVLDAYPDRAISFERAVEIVKGMKPTKQFLRR